MGEFDKTEIKNIFCQNREITAATQIWPCENAEIEKSSLHFGKNIR
ncbi:hypothetical protein [Selenomonas sp.]|nr:hypothetical protein [Selenomonas sp.]MDY3298300.1 hypothetical protein [Selenomonas sp.]